MTSRGETGIDWAARRRKIVALFDALPSEEGFALLTELLSRDAVAAHTSPVPLPNAVEAAHWLSAMAEHRLGKPEALARMLTTCVPLLGTAGAYVAEIITRSSTRTKVGRPSKKDDYSRTPGILSELVEVHHFRLEFGKCLKVWQAVPRAERVGTPTDNAIADIAKRYGLSEAAVRRKMWGEAPQRKKR